MAAPPRVIFILGSQEYFAERIIGEATDRWRRDGLEVREISATADGLLLDLVAAVSPDLFGSAPAIVLRDAEALDEKLGDGVLTLVDEHPETPWVIQHAGGRGSTKLRERLAAAADHSEKAEQLKGKAVGEFVQKEFRAQGKTADPQTIGLLVDAVGADPRGLASAVAQLASDIEEPHIGRDAAARYYSGHVAVKGYEIADAVVAKDPSAALAALRFAMQEGGTRAGLMTVTALSATFQRLAVAKSASGTGQAADVAAALKIPEWMARNAVNQARRWSSGQIAEAIGLLADLSVEMKGGYEADGALTDEQKEYVLERAVLQMADARG